MIRGQEVDYRWIGSEWVAVCDFCKGNCGQCGTSVGAGVPLDFDAVVERAPHGSYRSYRP